VRFRCKSKTDTKIDFPATEVRTSVQQFLNIRSNIKIKAESRSIAPASIKNQFPFRGEAVLGTGFAAACHGQGKKFMCICVQFVTKDSKSFTSSREKEIGWWIIATCTQRRTREALGSTLDTHKQRTRVRLHRPCHAPRLRRHHQHGLYLNYVVCRDYSLPGCSGSTSTSPCTMSTHLPAAAALNQLRRASRCLGTSHSSSHECLGTSRGSSSGSSSTTSPIPRVRVPRHIVRLVVNYFAYAAHPSASARRAARRAARRRLLCLLRVSRCFGTSRSSSLTTSPTTRVRVPRHVAQQVVQLIVDYCTYAARPGASACRAARLVTRRQLLRLTPLVVDYFAYVV
jgi:hypothetical protein